MYSITKLDKYVCTWYLLNVKSVMLVLGPVHMEPNQPRKRRESFRVFTWETLSPETGTFLCVTYMPKLKCKHNDSANMMHT